VEIMPGSVLIAALPVMLGDTHIVPVMVGDPEKCKAASDLLLTDYGIYIQPINYPTVPRRTERLRITPTPYHNDILIDQLAAALVDVWHRLALPRKGQTQAEDLVRSALPIVIGCDSKVPGVATQPAS
jgi:5-aminolevulinate synthase